MGVRRAGETTHAPLPVVVFVERLGRVLDGCRRHLSRLSASREDVASTARPGWLKRESRVFCFSRKPALLRPISIAEQKTAYRNVSSAGQAGLSIVIELGPRGRAVSLMRPARSERDGEPCELDARKCLPRARRTLRALARQPRRR